MLRPTSSRGIGKSRRTSRRSKGGCSYEKMMKTLLLQNQQIIIQQQNMMFMVMRQFQASSATATATAATATTATTTTTTTSTSSPPQLANTGTIGNSHEPHHILEHHHQIHDEHSIQQHQFISHHQAGTALSGSLDTQQQLQQVANHLHDNGAAYLTPAASEQDPIIDNKQEEEDLTALLEGDGLLANNLLYNPQTDIGSVTPYKNHHQQQQTPSYYSSGCESLTTPRVEQPRQPTNVSQNVVKNLADSFKSPTKPKINVQILSGSATRNMKNSKARIIQSMNISEFLRQVHHEEAQKSATQ